MGAAAATGTEVILPYDHSTWRVAQERGWDCGPASVQIVLQSLGVEMSETDLIRELGTDEDGTDTVEQALPVLNRVTRGQYMAQWMPNDPPTRAERDTLWERVTASIDAGFGCVFNFEVPSNNFPRGTRGSVSPQYRGARVWHYVACMGYADDGPGGRHFWIADPGFPPNGYWMSAEQAATAIPPHAYAYATAPASRPAPQPVPTMRPIIRNRPRPEAAVLGTVHGRPITGPGITSAIGMEAADLGIVRWDAQRGAYAVMFGDNFEKTGLRGEWRSPSIVMYDANWSVVGVPTADGIDPQGRVRQLWDYPHNNAEYTTILPTDFILVGDWWYVSAMVTAGLGNELRTVFWRSRDLISWEKTDPYIRLDHPSHPGNVMLTFDQIGEWVYIFGTAGLKRNLPIWLWRNKASEFPGGYWEPWGRDADGWGWGKANETTPVLEGRYGELCFRSLDGGVVLSFFDADRYCTSAITVPQPTADWSRGNRVDYASGRDFPQLYGGFITPASRLNVPDGMRFIVSQWNTQTNDPYHSMLFTATLEAMPPVLVPPTVPEPQPVPERPVPVDCCREILRRLDRIEEKLDAIASRLGLV